MAPAPRRFVPWLGVVLTILVVVTVLATVTRATDGEPMPLSPFANIASCVSGGLELTELQCDSSGDCTTELMRLTWGREGGVLFEGDGRSEREVLRLSPPRTGALLGELASALAFRSSDAAGRVCRMDGYDTRDCPVAGRKFGINAECSNLKSGRVFMRSSFQSRWQDAKLNCLLVGDSFDEARCKAGVLAKGLGSTHLSDRVIKMMKRMKEIASGTDE